MQVCDDKKGVAEQVQQLELNNVNTVSLTENMFVTQFTCKRARCVFQFQCIGT